MRIIRTGDWNLLTLSTGKLVMTRDTQCELLLSVFSTGCFTSVMAYTTIMSELKETFLTYINNTVKPAWIGKISLAVNEPIFFQKIRKNSKWKSKISVKSIRYIWWSDVHRFTWLTRGINNYSLLICQKWSMVFWLFSVDCWCLSIDSNVETFVFIKVNEILGTLYIIMTELNHFDEPLSDVIFIFSVQRY